MLGPLSPTPLNPDPLTLNQDSHPRELHARGLSWMAGGGRRDGLCVQITW